MAYRQTENRYYFAAYTEHAFDLLRIRPGLVRELFRTCQSFPRHGGLLWARTKGEISGCDHSRLKGQRCSTAGTSSSPVTENANSRSVFMT